MILDIFTILFNSNAKDAAKDTKDLEKQIDSLTAKGKNRSEAENKQLIQAKKQLKEVTGELKEQQKAVDNISNSFVSLIENGVGAFTALASFSVLKSGLLDAAKLNSELYVQQQITEQNAGELRGWASAVEAAGGSSQGFLGSLSAMTQKAAEAGLPLRNVTDLMRYFNQLVHQRGPDGQIIPEQEQRRLLTLNGITDPGMIALLEQSNDEFEKSIALMQKHADATNKAAPASREFEEQWSRTGQTFQDVYSIIDADILPIFTSLNKKVEEFGDYLANHPKTAEGFFGLMGIAAASASSAIAGVILRVGVLRSILLGLNGLKLLIPIGLSWEIGKAARDIATGSRDSYLGQVADEVSNWLVEKSERIMGTYRAPRAGVDGAAPPGPQNGNPILDIFDLPDDGGNGAEPYHGGPPTAQINGAGSFMPSSRGASGSWGPTEKNISVKIGDVSINTQATSTTDIAREFSSRLASEMRNAVTSIDDGVLA